MTRPNLKPRRRLPWSEYLALIQRLAGSDYAILAERYSFRSAWYGGFDPQQALDDARGFA